MGEHCKPPLQLPRMTPCSRQTRPCQQPHLPLPTNHLSAAGGGQLSTKTGHFPLHQQKLQGFVVGFSGSKVFCLHQVSMQTLDMPQSASMHRYLGNLEWDKAYQASPGCAIMTGGS